MISKLNHADKELSSLDTTAKAGRNFGIGKTRNLWNVFAHAHAIKNGIIESLINENPLNYSKFTALAHELGNARRPFGSSEPQYRRMRQKVNWQLMRGQYVKQDLDSIALQI